MKVEDVMTKDVASCGPDDVLAVPARVMWEHNCGVVPVVDADKSVLGVLTDRDICMSALIEGKTLHELTVDATMTGEVWSCRPDDKVEVVTDLMENHQLRRVVVTDEEGTLVGVVSLRDLISKATSSRARANQTLKRKVTEALASISQLRETALVSS